MRPPPSELRRLYWDEGLSTTEIGGRLGVSHETVRRWMNADGIARRPPAASGGGCPSPLRPDPEELRRLYWEEGLSCPEIGRRCRVLPATVMYWLAAAGVPRRDAREAVRAAHERTQYPNLAGFRGVKRVRNRFEANIRRNSRTVSLGYYDTAEEAHAAYRAAELRVRQGLPPKENT
jgi:hypothetical protein